MGEIIPLGREFVKDLLDKQMADPEVDAVGTVGPAQYPAELQQFRLNFIKQVIQISENLKVYYVEMVEAFFRTIVKSQWLKSGTPIDCVRLWQTIVSQTEIPSMEINFEKLIGKNGVGLAIPKVQIQGEVRDKDGNLK